MVDEDNISQTVVTLEHLAKFINIEDLKNHSDNCLLNEDFSIELRAEGELGVNPVGNRLDIEGVNLMVIFKNNTNIPLNLTVLDLRPLREIKRIYPPGDCGEWKVVQLKGIRHGISFLGEISFKIMMSTPDSIKTMESLGIEDIFKFFVTTRPSSFDGLELPELSERALGPSRTCYNFITSTRRRHIDKDRDQ